MFHMHDFYMCCIVRMYVLNYELMYVQYTASNYYRASICMFKVTNLQRSGTNNYIKFYL